MRRLFVGLLVVSLVVGACAGGGTTSTAEPLLSGGWLEEGWVARLESDQQFGVGGGSITGLVETDFGVVAVGGTCESLDETGTSADCSPAVWVSENGTDWTKVYGEEAGFGEGSMFAATRGGPGVVAVGSTCAVMPPPEGCALGIWTSADGYNWNPARIPETEFTKCEGPDCQLYAVANTGSTLVAAGWDGSGLGVWTSPDGLEWSKTVFDPDEFIPVNPLTPEVPGEGDIEHLLTFDGSVLALGTATVFEYEGDEFIEWWYPGAIWRSPDGISWSRADDPDGVFANLGDTTFWDVTTWRDSIYATGDGCDRNYDCESGVWSSPDGTTWTFTRFEADLESLVPQRIYGFADTLVITGTLRGRPVAITTLDGTNWQTNVLPGLFDAQMPANDLIRYKDQLIAVGGDQIKVWNP